MKPLFFACATMELLPAAVIQLTIFRGEQSNPNGNRERRHFLLQLLSVKCAESRGGRGRKSWGEGEGDGCARVSPGCPRTCPSARNCCCPRRRARRRIWQFLSFILCTIVGDLRFIRFIPGNPQRHCVCAENFIRFDWVRESHNVGDYGCATLLLLSGAVGLAVQIEWPT